ncbi:hypothetical protein Tsubulata_033643 [Turnera subulata]|uniref:AP2/ERF domain-containing protein n=1 Tax=Turnera subulata TaxID=218843 RepID=A0A9Q0JGP0_9ROSI|nr:hypothetical protein Tsubulata_033643 [Turnera subulata]
MSITEDPPEMKPSPLEPDPPRTRGSRKRTRQQHDTPYHGVRKRSWGRYVSEIRLPGKKTRVWLGSFTSPEMAARAYDSAAFFLKGNSACLNFPDSVGSLPLPESCATKDIQLAAARAALGFDEQAGKEESGSGCEQDSSIWVGLGELELGTVSFREVEKVPPLLSPLRFDFVRDEELLYSFVNDEDFLLASCF